MPSWKLILLLAYILATLLMAAATAKGYYADKRVRVQPSFQTSTRYGRSDGGLTKSRHNGNTVIAPRADRFYLGTRYGKRASTPSEPLIYPPISTPCGIYEDLSCTHTGVSNIYRCVLSKNDAKGMFSSSN